VRERVRNDPSWHFSRLRGPCASWVTEKRLDEQRRILNPIDFARLWLNEWQSGDAQSVFRGEDIDASLDDSLTPLFVE